MDSPFRYPHCPPTWQRRKLKYVGTLRGGAGFPDQYQGHLDRDFPFFKVKALGTASTVLSAQDADDTISQPDAATINATVFPRSSIVFAKIGAALLLSRFRQIKQPSCIDNNMMALITHSETATPLFMQYLLSTMDMAYVVNPGAVPSLDVGALANLDVMLPSVSIQNKITDFLDRESSASDASIVDYQQLVEAVEEKRVALITEAVTKGLDSNVPMKASGVEWIGNIPAPWNIAPLKRYYDVIDCKHLTVPFVDQGIPLASVREVQSFYVKLQSAKMTTTEYYEDLIEGARKPRRGDLIYCRNTSVGACAYVATDQAFAMGQDVCLIRPLHASNSKFLNYFMRSATMVAQLERAQVGATFGRINVESVRCFDIIAPSLDEQNAISDWLDTRLAELDAIARDAVDAINLVNERRRALIAAAITGQIDETPTSNSQIASEGA